MADKNQGGVESVLALVLYFAREGYWHHVQTVADQVIKKRGRAPVLSFWKAYAVAREGEFAAAIREFDDLRTKREVSIHLFASSARLFSFLLSLPPLHLFCRPKFLIFFLLTHLITLFNSAFIFFQIKKTN